LPAIHWFVWCAHRRASRPRFPGFRKAPKYLYSLKRLRLHCQGQGGNGSEWEIAGVGRSFPLSFTKADTTGGSCEVGFSLMEERF